MKMNMNEPVASDDAEMAWAFPSVDPGAKPLGGRVMVQIRRSKKRTTKAGIVLVEETKETEKWNTQIGKVVDMGSLAFRKRDSMEPWPEGAWCRVGDFIRVPKWGGDRWEVKVPGEDQSEDPALFMIINDHEVIAKITGNPLETRAFL
jgi:co-chaperonin GroES (HSP10)